MQMVFCVTAGQVTVVINATQFVAATGDSFFVPPHNTYNLLNTGEEVANLFIVQYKYQGEINPAAGSLMNF